MEMTKILLADDQAVIRNSLRRFLEMTGRYHVVAEADNGYTAVSMAKLHRPDIVIMDLSMPRLGGIEATRQIVENGIPTHVIILSMHTSHADIIKSIQAGASGYIHKSSVSSDIGTAINTVLVGNHYISPQLAIDHKNILIPAETIAHLAQTQISFQP